MAVLKCSPGRRPAGAYVDHPDPGHHLPRPGVAVTDHGACQHRQACRFASRQTCARPKGPPPGCLGGGPLGAVRRGQPSWSGSSTTFAMASWTSSKHWRSPLRWSHTAESLFGQLEGYVSALQEIARPQLLVVTRDSRRHWRFTGRVL